MKAKKELKSRIDAKELLREKLDVVTVKSSGMDVEYRSNGEPEDLIYLSAALTGEIVPGKVYAKIGTNRFILKTTPTSVGVVKDLKGTMIVINCSCKGKANVSCIFTVVIQDRVYHLSSQTDNNGLVDFIVIIHFN
ncbi:hypothetical protein ABE425_18875 [Chryseobacterium cucumeris]|uniref:hypothetical protein n=1 Tax=Chryseobacterium TaxID=59732 RepID=UPI000E735334|nr:MULTISPECIES: hypothetical protein [unclassified Chryseobacterium]RKE79006.1 hypothetical protein DEU39_3260 [Chryseobacterium sp. AG363]WNI35776.1 hypothetical protein RHP76_17570 [Chryseobacterium sp. SG20098]